MTLDKRRRRYEALTAKQRAALHEMVHTRLLKEGCDLCFDLSSRSKFKDQCPINGNSGDCDIANRQERYALWLLLSKREQPMLFAEDDVVIPSRIEE